MSGCVARKAPAAARGGLSSLAQREQNPDRQPDAHDQPPIVADLPQERFESAEQPWQQDHGADCDHPDGKQADGESGLSVHRRTAKLAGLAAASENRWRKLWPPSGGHEFGPTGRPVPGVVAIRGRRWARHCRWCCLGGDGRHGGDRVEFAKHLLVDGYNIAHAWPDLRRVLATEGREVARARLVERVRILHDFERLRVSVVFDGRGADIVIERPTPHTTFSVVYTPGGMTADDLIEQLTVQAAQPRDVCVATADAAERDTIEAAGAQALSPEQLAAWVERAEQAQRAAVAAQQGMTESRWRAGGRR